ncbi:MAG TPA: zf-HC2 domain-containing protein [Ktedonobacterales bacterium]|jgi:anti-sigma factor RsiW|nr:zf-HC2 domain-containing protein [Ktedonobacterales bacterium]
MQELTCKELVELVTAYFEDALPADERLRFERHVSVCPGCSAYMEQMRQTITLVGELREQDVSPTAEQQLLQAFRGWKRDET